MTAHPDRTVLRGGTVIDGTGAPRCDADVVIVGDRIGHIGEVAPRPDDRTVDCRGRFVMPGFIDAHAHADGAVFQGDVQLALLRQGITTVVGGQDGVSYAPGDGTWATRYFAAINGPHPTYAGGGVAELLRSYDDATPVNVGYLVPAGTVRHEVMGMDSGRADAAQLARMQQLVADGLDAGALGLSTGLDYVPGHLRRHRGARRAVRAGRRGGRAVRHAHARRLRDEHGGRSPRGRRDLRRGRRARRRAGPRLAPARGCRRRRATSRRGCGIRSRPLVRHVPVHARVHAGVDGGAPAGVQRARPRRRDRAAVGHRRSARSCGRSGFPPSRTSPASGRTGRR